MVVNVNQMAWVDSHVCVLTHLLAKDVKIALILVQVNLVAMVVLADLVMATRFNAYAHLVIVDSIARYVIHVVKTLV